MSDAYHQPGRYESLRASRRALARLAPVLQFALFGAGLLVFVHHVSLLTSDVQLVWRERFEVGVLALVDLGGFGLGGWVAGRLLRASGELIDVVLDQAEATVRGADLLERHVAPALDRLAVAMERAAAEPRARDDGRVLALAGVRQAIEANRWALAEKLIRAFARDYPQAPEAAALQEELEGTRQTAIDGLRSRLDAARSANDPAQVITLRDELTQHLHGDPLRELDRQLIAWLMMLIQKRLRSGTARADVAELAARVAESFGDTPEGASLRASLPVLRRSAGLCPRCAQPYVGTADACPQCQAAATRPAVPPTAAEPPAAKEAS